jgi:hypothetical protein
MSQMRNVSGPCKRLLMGEADEHPAFALEPDMQISRIRLSDKTSRLHPRQV